MDLNDVLVDLYLRAPSEFVPIRAGRARVLRAEGNAEDAARVAALPKPSAAAWAANLLAARRSRELGQLVELGARMREAESDLAAAELRQLGKQRLALIRSIAGLGNDLAIEAGHRMSAKALGELEQTLQAAMSDEAAADAVRSGRLARALFSSGIDPVDLDGAVAVPSLPVRRVARPTLRAVDDPAAERRLAEAEERAEQAQTRVAAAQDVLRELRSRRTALAEHRLALSAERDSIADQLDAIDRQLAAADRDENALARSAASADHDAEVAMRTAERAESRLAELRGSGSERSSRKA